MSNLTPAQQILVKLSPTQAIAIKYASQGEVWARATTVDALAKLGVVEEFGARRRRALTVEGQKVAALLNPQWAEKLYEPAHEANKVLDACRAARIEAARIEAIDEDKRRASVEADRLREEAEYAAIDAASRVNPIYSY